MTDDTKASQQVSRKYRELGAEEPPRALDEAILGAATRAARSSRGSAWPWTKRWAVPLSLAAVITLSVTVTLRIQHEQPGIESPAPQAPQPAAEKEAAKEAAKPAAAGEVGMARRNAAEKTVASRAVAPPAPAAAEPKPFAADQAPSAAAARADELRGAASGAVRALAKRAEAQEKVQALKDADTPEQELERIAGLRREQKHEEADKALAEFRKRHPDYKIPEAMRERVERR